MLLLGWIWKPGFMRFRCQYWICKGFWEISPAFEWSILSVIYTLQLKCSTFHLNSYHLSYAPSAVVVKDGLIYFCNVRTCWRMQWERIKKPSIDKLLLNMNSIDALVLKIQKVFRTFTFPMASLSRSLNVSLSLSCKDNSRLWSVLAIGRRTGSNTIPDRTKIPSAEASHK